ncbi:MAG: hypothetical protein K2X66_02720 [Cyanobacteria bacterium]|nr:hypothetical protein [Cyanobacteriota bacterium]
MDNPVLAKGLVCDRAHHKGKNGDIYLNILFDFDFTIKSPVKPWTGLVVFEISGFDLVLA